MPLPSAHVLFQLPPLSMSPEPLCRFPIRSGFWALRSTVDSFDAHIYALSKSCFYHICALRHIRPNLTLDCSKNIAGSLVSCRLDYANSILVLRTFLGFNVCKARSLVLSHVSGDASASPRHCRSFIGFLSSGA